ncbi:MAG: hypothetical protein WCE20_14400 [Rhizomicrobium sp.]
MPIPVENIVGDGEEDTKLLKEMVVAARNYISSFEWSQPITAMYFAYGIGGILALFLVEFAGKIAGTDSRLWVIVGDLPPAYMIVEPDSCAQNILESYCSYMDEWVEAVKGNGDFSGVYPVAAPRTLENAEMLRSRLEFIRREIIPDAPTDLVGEPAR